MHGLAEVLSFGEPLKTCLGLPGTKDPVAACLLSMRLTVARVKPIRAAIAPCLMPSRASANTSCLIPIGVGRGIVRTIRKTFEKICRYWFKVVTVWRLIWGNDHLYCGFGARRSHLTLHWMYAQVSVGFRWGTITGPYHANFSQVETQKFDPHWLYCLQWGCNNLFLPRAIKPPKVLAIPFVDDSQSKETLRWRHNDRDGVSNHQPHGSLLNR